MSRHFEDDFHDFHDDQEFRFPERRRLDSDAVASTNEGGQPDDDLAFGEPDL